LRHTHGAAELAYGVYEGVAFSMKEILSANQALGVEVAEIISGTPDDNRAWSQMRADVYGLSIAFPDTTNLTGLGCALLALVGLGVFADLPAAMDCCCRITQRITPDPQRTADYAQRFELYQRAVDANRVFMHQQPG
jgi:sugar (pentulose or hexulose) kinase